MLNIFTSGKNKLYNII